MPQQRIHVLNDETLKLIEAWVLFRRLACTVFYSDLVKTSVGDDREWAEGVQGMIKDFVPCRCGGKGHTSICVSAGAASASGDSSVPGCSCRHPSMLHGLEARFLQQRSHRRVSR